MKILVTGSTGYIGHQLAKKLAENGYSVIALVRDINSPKIPEHENIMPVKGDICDYRSVVKATEGCDYVFHTAAYTNLKYKKIDKFYTANVLGTKNILEASLKADVKKVIYTSTLSVYGTSYKNVPIQENQPRLVAYANDYELTKTMAEELVEIYTKKGLSTAILNVSRVYGPRLDTFSNGVNRLMLKMIKNHLLVVPSRLNIVTNYVFIDDVVNAHVLAISDENVSGKYIVGGEDISYQKLFETIKRKAKSKIKIISVPYHFVKACLSLLNGISFLIGLSFGITPKLLDVLFQNRLASSNRAINQLGYTITPFKIGVERTINFLKLSL
ncbi:NAD-dependent epimerase/dehydratase family protein [Aestuariivivens sp. NBU2969]|uniref:NAD-dependent epimerase/dehydratase family protein n=1 Tax=Aestuariivivens sp. NBU2969 TaxID=2873267 RepID=UPI001CBC1E55|nr:NAD-dependent epimerase/dehydratase family protein [Aestuariivivens sp. NBU2969]